MKRVLDKIRFVMTFPKGKGNNKYKAHLGAAHELVGQGEYELRHDVPYQTAFQKSFKGISEKTGLRLTFGSTKAGAFIAIDCTPHKLTDDEWANVCGDFSAIFGGPEVVAKKFKLFEVELAVDISHPIADFIYIVPKLRKQNYFTMQKGGFELGSQQGSRWVRIYDKKKQLKQVKGIQSPTPLTRIEFVRRRLQFTLASCLSMQNPFNEIVVVPRDKVGAIQKEDPTDFVFAHFAKKIAKGISGHDAYWGIEDADMRKAIRKRLGTHTLNLAGTQAEWDKWISSEIAFLKDKFKP